MPQTAGARSGKRLQLNGRAIVLERDGDYSVVVLVNFQPELHATLGFNAEGAEIHRRSN